MTLLIPQIEIVHIEKIGRRGIKRLHVLLIHLPLGADVSQDHVPKIVVRSQDGGVVIVIAEISCLMSFDFRYPSWLSRIDRRIRRCCRCPRYG